MHNPTFILQCTSGRHCKGGKKTNAHPKAMRCARLITKQDREGHSGEGGEEKDKARGNSFAPAEYTCVPKIKIKK